MDQLGPESKISLSMKSIDVKDLVGQLDLSNSITKENVITVDLINGKYVTKIRIPNNVLIYKEDLKEFDKVLFKQEIKEEKIVPEVSEYKEKVKTI